MLRTTHRLTHTLSLTRYIDLEHLQIGAIAARIERVDLMSPHLHIATIETLWLVVLSSKPLDELHTAQVILM